MVYHLLKHRLEQWRKQTSCLNVTTTTIHFSSDTYCGNVAICSKGTKFNISMVFRTNVQIQHLFLAISSSSWWVNTSPTLMLVCALHLPLICVLHLKVVTEMCELLILIVSYSHFQFCVSLTLDVFGQKTL